MGSESDRRVLLAIVLSLAVYYLWMAFVAPRPSAAESGAAATATAPQPVAPSATEAVAGAPAASEAAPSPPVIAPAPPVERGVRIATDAFSGEVHSSDGALRNLTLDGFDAPIDVTPVWIWLKEKVLGASGGWHPYAGGDDPERLLGPQGALVLAGAGSLAAGGPAALDEKVGALAATTSSGDVEIVRSYVRGPDARSVDVTVSFANRGSKPVNGLWIGVADRMSGVRGRYGNAVAPVAHADGGVKHLADVSEAMGPGAESYTGPVRWFGLDDRYFMSVLFPLGPLAGTESVVFDDLPDGRVGSFLVLPESLEPGATRKVELRAYIGPKELALLEPLGNELSDAVEFGWFGFFARILLVLLRAFQSVVVNWGVAIILLTLLVKLLFYPLTHKAFHSGQKMRLLQPKLNEIKEKYKDNRELQTQETMRLFKESDVNPMGGCLPTIVQIPVWIALYNVLLYSVELYDRQFLYLRDLTGPDPFGVLPTVVAVLMYVQQLMTPMTGMDPMQEKMMRFMPLVFALFMYSFPSGLTLYITVNSALSILQMWWIRRSLEAAPAPA